MDNDIQRRVNEFVAEYVAFPRGRLHPGTTLLGDLEITGDDADDFFVEFRDRFNVDVSTLDLSRQFVTHRGSESYRPVRPVLESTVSPLSFITMTKQRENR